MTEQPLNEMGKWRVLKEEAFWLVAGLEVLAGLSARK